MKNGSLNLSIYLNTFAYFLFLHLMKKVIEIALCVCASALFFACSNSTDLEKPDEIDAFTQEGVVSDSVSSKDSTVDKPNSSDSVETVGDTASSFIYLTLKPKKVILGTNDSNARVEDRPAMDVSLNYSFYMARHEVTRGEFCKLMKCKAPIDSADFPQVNVTLYDAILYANALSKQDKFDTVYTYSKAEFDNEGKCIFLHDLSTAYNANGFRLPTEAEWVYTANLNWNVDDSWNASNSGFTIHEVCTAPHHEASAFCDMEGNVMEWVNDWAGKYFDTTITNYAGAPIANSKGERMVKGGCFNKAPKDIKIFSRSDTYTVTSISSADYVGFRLARGAVPDAVFLNDAGTAENVVVNSLVDANDVFSAVGSKKVKLVFRNDVTGNLAFIYYRDGNDVVEILDTIDSYHPDVSPDGKYVAFCTKPEGVSGTSELYVRKLDSEGSGLQRLNVKSAAIPRFRVLPNNDTVVVYVSDAGNNKNNSTWEGYSTWQVPFRAGKFGTPQKLYDGSYHGGISESGRLAVSGARILRARIEDGAHDTVWYNGEQACNVSLSTDGTSRTLFLDFGGKTGRDFVGSSYQTHQQILVADSNGVLLHSVKSPSGYTFDHSEWVRGKNMSVATLANANGVHEKIALVDMETGSILELVESEELWHPCMWVESSLSKKLSSSSRAELASQSSSSVASSAQSSSSVEIAVQSSAQSSAQSSGGQNAETSGSAASSSSSEKSTVTSSENAQQSSEKSSSSAEPNSSTVSSSSGKLSSSSVTPSSSSAVPSSSVEALSSSSEFAQSHDDELYFDFDMDSVGVYSKVGSSFHDFIMRYKMELLWQYKESDVVIIGSSRPMDGVIPKNFDSKFNVVNLAQTPNSIFGSRDFFKNYIFAHYKKLKYLIVSLDIDFWWKTETYENVFYTTMKNYAGYIYDKNHNYWAGYNTDDLYSATQDSPGKSDMEYFIEEKGVYSIGSCLSRAQSNSVIHDSTSFDKNATLRTNSVNALKDIIELAATREITVIGVIFPMSPKYKETGAYGRYGLRRSTSYDLVKELKGLGDSYSNFVFLDENKYGDHDYPYNMFEDDQHLCGEGAKQITERLNSLILTLE